MTGASSILRTGAVAKDKGNAVAALAASARKVEAVYEAPFLAHATMEPMNCAVSVTAGGCDIWVGTQIPTRAQKAVASALGLKPEGGVCTRGTCGDSDNVVERGRPDAQHVSRPASIIKGCP